MVPKATGMVDPSTQRDGAKMPVRTTATLRRPAEIDAAVDTLKARGIAVHPVWFKNWDLSLTISFICDQLPLSAAILDAGARWSPILVRLEALGFRNLFACDVASSFREGLLRRLRRSSIRFTKCDLTRTPYKGQSLDVVTCLSVIEHGVNVDEYLREMSRLLRPGGYLITSTDFWREPINTTGIYPYGPAFGEMKVFQPEGIRELVQIGKRYGFVPLEPLDLECEEPVVYWERVDRRYTFTFLVLRKQ